MDKLLIQGGRPLHGEIPVGGAKNAALPLMTASLLTAETLTLDNVPQLADIETLERLLEQHGTAIREETIEHGRALHLTTGEITDTTAPYDLVRKMRASILVLGALLARAGQARVSLPGGCAIGNRPVDLHLRGLAEMGAEIDLDGGYVNARVDGRLKGASVLFPTVSVGATENLLMAATLADGVTTLRNAAREPEVADLAKCLIAMGAQIEGIGTDTLRITGVESLHGARHEVVPDRIEAGTYAMAAAITGGEVELINARAELIEAVIESLDSAGVSLEPTGRGLRVRRANGQLIGCDVMTEPFPGFPTDLQAQMMAMMTIADGAAMITETIFENRFMHVPELSRMGARIQVHTASALVRGVPKLKGAQVMATDLRASSSLIIAALAAEGESEINRIYHLDRGYERLEEKLAACGALVERVKG